MQAYGFEDIGGTAVDVDYNGALGGLCDAGCDSQCYWEQEQEVEDMHRDRDIEQLRANVSAVQFGFEMFKDAQLD